MADQTSTGHTGASFYPLHRQDRGVDPSPSFPAIEEDEAPYRLLCNEYPAAKD